MSHRSRSHNVTRVVSLYTCPNACPNAATPWRSDLIHRTRTKFGWASARRPAIQLMATLALKPNANAERREDWMRTARIIYLAMERIAKTTDRKPPIPGGKKSDEVPSLFRCDTRGNCGSGEVTSDA
jgi:hypothetical protein